MYPQYAFQRSVLVIDDFRKSENLIRQGLLSHPVHFEFCQGDYDKALRKMNELRPDILIVSLEFEKGSVLDFAAKMQKEWAHVPSLFMTEPHLIEIQKSVLKMAPFEIIERPANGPAELIHRMEQLVRAYRKPFAVE